MQRINNGSITESTTKFTNFPDCDESTCGLELVDRESGCSLFSYRGFCIELTTGTRDPMAWWRISYWEDDETELIVERSFLGISDAVNAIDAIHRGVQLPVSVYPEISKLGERAWFNWELERMDDDILAWDEGADQGTEAT